MSVVLRFATWDDVPRSYEGWCFVETTQEQCYVKEISIHYDELNPNGPSCISEKSLSWYRDGFLHNLNGPALCYLDDGEVEYYIHGVQYSEESFFRNPLVIANKLKNLSEIEL